MQPDSKSPDEQPSNTQSAPLPAYTPSPSPNTISRQAPAVTLNPEPLVQPEAQPLVNPSLAQTEQEVLEAIPEAEENDQPVRWQANEYVHHEKSPIWFTIFGVVVVVLMAVAIFLIKDISFSILIPVMAAALLVFANRPPRVIDYTLSKHGLHVNDKLYSFNEFKGFRVIHDGEEFSVMLIPVKRFKPGVSVYFPEAAGEAIVDTLGARLPMQDFQLDLVDKIIRKLRI